MVITVSNNIAMILGMEKPSIIFILFSLICFISILTPHNSFDTAYYRDVSFLTLLNSCGSLHIVQNDTKRAFLQHSDFFFNRTFPVKLSALFPQFNISVCQTTAM